MTTIAASPSTLDTSVPPAPSSLVQHAFEAAPPRSSEWVEWHTFTEEDRADAIGTLAVAIRRALPLLSPDERHEFAAEVLNGVECLCLPGAPRHEHGAGGYASTQP